MKTIVVVPWHNPEQLARFLKAWGKDESDPLLMLQQDKEKEGCARTKNKGIQEAMRRGAEVVVILDDDCFASSSAPTLEELVRKHQEALKPQRIEMFQAVTSPPSRGTPYFERHIEMPVAASMGYWQNVPDYDAPSQLVHGARHPMLFQRTQIFGKMFPLCGMNLAFRLEEWPWCQFQPHERFDDIFQGLIWERSAYERGLCFNLNGPDVTHSRQSNVWANLRAESKYLEANETVWQKIIRSPSSEYEDLVKLLPPV